ncbi:putative acetyltransferase [Sporosarcina luteola]|nr:putative acetyltransferase [Sporosarcina luteola]
MQIREIEKKDNMAMERIIKESLESYQLDIPGTAYFDPQLSNLADYYKNEPNANYWVLVDEAEQVAGGVGIARFGKTGTICELQKLYIKPEAQGLGHSKKLMETALNFAKEHYTHCYLETMDKLETANHLYAKLGFQRLERPLDGSEHSTMDRWYLKELVRE